MIFRPWWDTGGDYELLQRGQRIHSSLPRPVQHGRAGFLIGWLPSLICGLIGFGILLLLLKVLAPDDAISSMRRTSAAAYEREVGL